MPPERSHDNNKKQTKIGIQKQKSLHKSMIYRGFFLYSKRDLNPHSHHWPKDFKSPPNPPFERAFQCSYLIEILVSTFKRCQPFELLFLVWFTYWFTHSA